MFFPDKSEYWEILTKKKKKFTNKNIRFYYILLNFKYVPVLFCLKLEET